MSNTKNCIKLLAVLVAILSISLLCQYFVTGKILTFQISKDKDTLTGEATVTKEPFTGLWQPKTTEVPFTGSTQNKLWTPSRGKDKLWTPRRGKLISTTEPSQETSDRKFNEITTLSPDNSTEEINETPTVKMPSTGAANFDTVEMYDVSTTRASPSETPLKKTKSGLWQPKTTEVPFTGSTQNKLWTPRRGNLITATESNQETSDRMFNEITTLFPENSTEEINKSNEIKQPDQIQTNNKKEKRNGKPIFPRITKIYIGRNLKFIHDESEPLKKQISRAITKTTQKSTDKKEDSKWPWRPSKFTVRSRSTRAPSTIRY